MEKSWKSNIPIFNHFWMIEGKYCLNQDMFPYYLKIVLFTALIKVFTVGSYQWWGSFSKRQEQIRRWWADWRKETGTRWFQTQLFLPNRRAEETPQTPDHWNDPKLPWSKIRLYNYCNKLHRSNGSIVSTLIDCFLRMFWMFKWEFTEFN